MTSIFNLTISLKGFERFLKGSLENCPLDDLVVYELLCGMEYNICGGIRVDEKVNVRDSDGIVKSYCKNNCVALRAGD